MILNDKQFAHKVQEHGTKCIMFYEGHSELDHDVVRPFKRIGGGQNEKLSNQDCLDQLKEFSKLYPEAYSCYIHTTSASIIQNGFFCKIDLRIKAVKPVDAPSQPLIDKDEIREELRKEIRMENQVEELTETVKEQKEIIAHNELVGNKMASVGLKMLQQFGLEMEGAGAPMQGETTASHTGAFTIQSAVDYMRAQLGDDFIITLAEKIKESNDKGEVPNLATKLKGML